MVSTILRPTTYMKYIMLLEISYPTSKYSLHMSEYLRCLVPGPVVTYVCTVCAVVLCIVYCGRYVVCGVVSLAVYCVRIVVLELVRNKVVVDVVRSTC